MSYVSEVLADNPKAFFRMQEASGLIQDSSGLAHHATSQTGTPLYNGTPVPVTSDPSARHIAFDGNDYFSIPDHTDLDFGDTVSVEAWIYLAALGSVRVWTGRGSAGALSMGTNTDNTVFAAKANVGIIVSSTTTIPEDTWKHVVYTKSGATSKIYIDAIDRTGTITNQTLADVGTALVVGADYDGTFGWNGALTEVAFYSTALSQARVQAHFDAATATAINYPLFTRTVGIGARRV